MVAVLKGEGIAERVKVRDQCAHLDDAEAVAKWTKEDNKAYSYIMRSIPHNVVDALGGFNTTAKLWKAIEDRYGKINPVEVMRLKTELLSITVK